MVNRFSIIMLNGLGLVFLKLGWALKKWNGLIIDLVAVNQIICTPLLPTLEAKRIKFVKFYTLKAKVALLLYSKTNVMYMVFCVIIKNHFYY